MVLRDYKSVNRWYCKSLINYNIVLTFYYIFLIVVIIVLRCHQEKISEEHDDGEDEDSKTGSSGPPPTTQPPPSSNGTGKSNSIWFITILELHMLLFKLEMNILHKMIMHKISISFVWTSIYIFIYLQYLTLICPHQLNQVLVIICLIICFNEI